MAQSYTDWPNFGPNFEQNHPFFQDFLKFGPMIVQICENFEKIDKFIHQILQFIRDHLYTKRLDFATHVGGTSR